MIILQWCKMQVMCLLILAYIGIIFMREGNQLNRISQNVNGNPLFDVIFIVSEMAVLFDGITACTINFTDQVPRIVNLLLHFCMFISYQIYMLLLFWYWVTATVGVPKRKWIKTALLLPGILSIGLMTALMPRLQFIQGVYTNYSMGAAVYVCFSMVGVYFVLTIAVIVAKNRNIPVKKRKALSTTLACIVIIMSLQIIFPEFLVTSIAIAMITISIYINIENPAIRGLEHYQHEMVMGFATLVENKDDSTGGHIRRTSEYAVLIAKQLRKMAKYKAVITKDYMDHLEQSAPMHDIGKIGIPDAILQKPGKLTDEEYDKMKEHPVIGGKIIEDTFGHLFDDEYENMAYQVAMYHHEKWNGKGYPTGLAGMDIPLCARIMAVADVFDAVSAKRCYRDAMPLEECYRIIESGRGTDFDPDVVDAFMMNRDQVEEIYYSNR